MKKESSEGQGRTVFDRLCLAYGVASVAALADRISQPLPTVKGWKQRDSVPLEHLIQAAGETGRSLDWIVREVESSGSSFDPKTRGPTHAAEDMPLYGPKMTFSDGRSTFEYCLVPRFAVKAAAGPGADTGQLAEERIGEIAFEREWMRSVLGRAGSGFALVDVAGTSMEPTLRDGQTTVVDLNMRDLVDGSVYVLRDGAELIVKRLQRMIGGTVEVISDNAAFRSQVIDDPDRLTIIGKVVWPKVG